MNTEGGHHYMVRQERAEATRQQILDAAARVFTQNGYVRANLGDIVAHATVTKGALYFHFDSKESLARAVIAERDVRLDDARRTIVESGAPPLESIIQQTMVLAALHHRDIYVRSGNRLTQELGFPPPDSPSSPEAARRVLQESLDQAMERGDVQMDDSEALAQILWSQWWGASASERMFQDGHGLLLCLERMWCIVIDSIVPGDMRPYFRQITKRAAEMQMAKSTRAAVSTTP